MKKVLTIFVALAACLMLTVPAMACWGPDCSQQAYDSGSTSIGNYVERGNQKAGGWAGYEGDTYRSGYAEGQHLATTGGTDGQRANMFGDYGNLGNFAAGAYTGAAIRGDSTQFAFGDGWRCYQDTFASVNGMAGQGTYAGVGGNNYYAGGGQMSEAGYSAYDWGRNFSHADGQAATLGGTAAFGFSTGNFTMAGAATGSMGNANAHGDYTNTFAQGHGEVEHGTIAYNNRGVAGTSGYAEYTYSDFGNRYASGAGAAVTFGTASVRNLPNGGVEARSSSMSSAISTGNYGGYDN